MSMKFPKGYRVRFSDDGNLLVCLGRNIVVIDVAARQRLSTSHPFSHPSHASFSPDGSKLAIKNTSGRIVVIDPRSGEVLYDHKNQKDGEGSEVHFASNGNELVDGSWNGVLTVRDAIEGDIVSRELFPGEMIRPITTDQNRNTWLIGHSPKIAPGETIQSPDYMTLRAWPLSKTAIRVFSLTDCVVSPTLSPDGQYFCFLDSLVNGNLTVARTSDGSILAHSEPTAVSGGTGWALEWSPDGQFIASVQDRKFVFYSSSNLEPVGEVPSPYPSSMSFRPGAADIALGSWNASTIAPLDAVLEGRLTLK